jgi:hypothetical protein
MKFMSFKLRFAITILTSSRNGDVAYTILSVRTYKSCGIFNNIWYYKFRFRKISYPSLLAKKFICSAQFVCVCGADPNPDFAENRLGGKGGWGGGGSAANPPIATIPNWKPQLAARAHSFDPFRVGVCRRGEHGENSKGTFLT